MAINENDYTDHEVTVRRLATTVDEIWNNKIKPTFATKAEVVTNVEWDSINNKITKTVNGTTTDVVTASDMKSSMSLTKSDVGLSNVDNTSDATKKSNFMGSLADGSTGFVTGGAVYDALASKANLDSPAFTGTPTAPTPSAGDDSTQIATTAFVKTAVEQGLSVADALIYKGTIAGGSSGNYGALTPAASKGDVYKVTTAGKVDGIKVEIGDMIICNADNTAAATSSNYSTIVGNWDFVQTNLDGVVIGPSSSTDSHVALFNGASGKEIKDGGALGGLAFKSTVSNSDINGTIADAHIASASTWNGKQDALPISGTPIDTYAINIKGTAGTANYLRYAYVNKSSQTTKMWKKIATSKTFTTWDSCSICFLYNHSGYVNEIGLDSIVSVTIRTGNAGSLANARIDTYSYRSSSETQLVRIGGTTQYEVWVKVPTTDTNMFATVLNTYGGWTINTDESQTGQLTDDEFTAYKSSNPSVGTSYNFNIVKASKGGVGSSTVPVYVDQYGTSTACSGALVTSAEKSTWNGKQDALTYADGKYAINISGNADSATSATTASYASAATTGSALADAILPNADVAFLKNGGDSPSTYANAMALYRAGKKLYLQTGGSIQPSGTFEYHIPLTFITYDANQEVNAFYFEQTQNDRAGASEVGSIAVYRLDSTGWTTTPKPVGYATNAGDANHAASADKAVLDGGGSDIRATYTQRIENNVTYQNNTPSLTVRSCQSIGNYTDAYNYKYFKIETTELPLANVWSKTINAPKYYYKNSTTEPLAQTIDGVSLLGSYVGQAGNDPQGMPYGNPTGFTCIAHEDTNLPGLLDNSQKVPMFTGGYFTIDFDVVMTVCNTSRAQYDNPPSALNLTFALKIDNGSPSDPRYLGFGIGDAIATSRTTVPFRKGYGSYAHIRMIKVLPATSGRIYIGAFQNSVSDGSVFMHSENFVATWINRTFTHD